MEKPILATTIKGILIKSSAWEDAHTLWFDERELELKQKNLDTSVINRWRKYHKETPKEKYNYFPFVIKVMDLLYPELSKDEKTKIARRSYFNSVVEFVKQDENKTYREIVSYLKSLKDNYRIGLITTNVESALESILNASQIEKGVFDLIETSRWEEEDDKEVVFERFIKKYGKPAFYIGSSEKSIEYCRKNEIKSIPVDFEGKGEVEGAVNNLEELKKRIIEI